VIFLIIIIYINKETAMKMELDKIFKNYDFGFDLELVSAENWLCDNNHYYRQVYLEDKTKHSTPILATFHIYFENEEKIRQVVVQM
jgi:hypothetical protein